MEIDTDAKSNSFPFRLIKKNVKKNFKMFNGFHGNIFKVSVSPSIFFYEIKIDNETKIVHCL